MQYSTPIRLLLAYLSEDPHLIDQIQLAEVSAADWQALAALSQEQGVTPLLYRHIMKTPGSANIPEDFLQNLREISLSTLKRNLRIFKDVGQILRALAEQKIPVIPLKGVYLAEKVYGNIGLRSMVDVDLLVHRPDLARAMVVMEGLGYRPLYPLDIERECQNWHHLPKLLRHGSMNLEFHWTLLPVNSPFHITIEQLWDRSQSAILEGVEVRIMAPEDLLLHLCLHVAYMDSFSGKLRPFCDIAWTIQTFKKKLDWERLALRAQEWGAVRSAWLALRVTQQLLGVLVPDTLIEKIQPTAYNPILESWAIEQIFTPSEIGPKLAAAWAPQPWPQRLAHIFHSLFPPAWEMRQKYPGLVHRKHWQLAYLKHLEVVFQRHWGSIWRLLKGDALVREAVEQRSRVNILEAWQAGEIDHIVQ